MEARVDRSAPKGVEFAHFTSFFGHSAQPWSEAAYLSGELEAFKLAA
jgi:hypothetical protein